MAPRTRAQLAEALRKREVPEEAAEAVLERFSEVGLIDDEAFAAAWVSSRHAGRVSPEGPSPRSSVTAGWTRDREGSGGRSSTPSRRWRPPAASCERKLSADPRSGARGQDPEAGRHARPKGYGPGLAFRVIREALEDEGAGKPCFPVSVDYPLD